MDVFRPVDPIALFGSGWYALETHKDESFRWVSNDARMNVARLRSMPYTVTMTLEPGPGVGLKPFDLQVINGSSKPVASIKVEGRQSVSFELPGGEPAVDRLTLHVNGGGKAAIGDDRILNFRIFKISMEPAPSEIVRPGIGLKLGSGWYPLETFNGDTFRWAGNESIVEAQDPQKAGELYLEVEPGPGVGYAPFKLSVVDASGQHVHQVEITQRQEISIPLPKTSEAMKLRLQVDSGGKSVPGDARILNFRAFALTD